MPVSELIGKRVVHTNLDYGLGTIIELEPIPNNNYVYLVKIKFDNGKIEHFDIRALYNGTIYFTNNEMYDILA